jgi:putative DNA methylase
MKGPIDPMIEHRFDIPFIANLALREKQIQQNYRPIIAVHKWFARRPGTLFRGLLLSEFAEKPLVESFYNANYLQGIQVADPFMGGGTPLLEANRVGCDVVGCDINPMSYWIVKQELEHLDLDKYADAAWALRAEIETRIGRLYRTPCAVCGAPDAHVKYFLWVKVLPCEACQRPIDLFPGYLIAKNRRHPRNVFVCGKCGALTETDSQKTPGDCSNCGQPLTLSGPAKRNRCACPDCGGVNHYPRPERGPLAHRLFALEYHCPKCKPGHKGRFFKSPGPEDLDKVRDATRRWKKLDPSSIPDDAILHGDESDRLFRWGYGHYHEMFNDRQKLALELSCRLILSQTDERVRNALATNLSDLLRYQNMLCRYDTMALKSLDIFSVHGFPVGLIQCESNFLGIRDEKRNISIGSGGWSNIIDKFTKAKAFCDAPFEIAHRGGVKTKIAIPDEWIGDHDNGSGRPKRQVDIACMDAAEKDLAPGSLDAVFTDPPYFGNVQYAELMDFCYIWLRKLLGGAVPAFFPLSTRHAKELTGNENMKRDLVHFAEGLSSVYRKMADALKPGAPFAFTYHHNSLSAYYPVAVALLDAGLTCCASFPCPAEMGASIHISNTKSSIIDTVFVSRSTGKMRREWIPDSPLELARIVTEDLEALTAGNITPTIGDKRCIIFGHLTRLAVWFLRHEWNPLLETTIRLKRVEEWIEEFGGIQGVEAFLDGGSGILPPIQQKLIAEDVRGYGDADDEIPF